MTTSTFDQFEAYVAAVEDADLRMMLPCLEVPHWELNAFSVGDFHVQYGREGSGNITEGSSLPGGEVIFVPISGLHRANGIPMRECSVFLMRPGCEFTISVLEEHQWCSVFVPWWLTDTSRQGCSSRIKGESCRVLELDNQRITRLRWVLTRLTRAILVEPKVLTEPSSLRSVQRDLKAACKGAIAVDSDCDEVMGRPRLPRRDLIQAVRKLLDQHIDAGLTIGDLATATDVSERTLRSVFVEFFGVPPKQFLMTHRLHRVRGILRTATPDETSVTAVAAKFGFWHFGRFAGAYRKLFGESPSTTLFGSARQRMPSLVSK